MRILLARTAGFCLGVRRATAIAVDAVREGKSPVHTVGPLIHNQQAVELLAARGIQTTDLEHLPDAGAVIVRAHGITPREQAHLAAHDLELIDATCPHVLSSQNRIRQASEAGKAIVLVGDPDHPEVKGLAGHADTPVHCIDSLAQAETVDPTGDFVVLAQTTFQHDVYDQITAVLQRRFPGCQVYDSICNATAMRQAEARALASRCDVLVVVGGKHSANTRRLAAVGAQAGTRTLHVETADELRAEDFADAQAVGVIAGASTPVWMTQHVIDRLETFGPRDGWSYLRRLIRIAARARITTALGAGGLCHAINQFMNAGPTPWTAVGMVTAFVFVAYTCNRREPPEESTRVLVPVDRFYRQNRRLLLACAAVAFVISLLLARAISHEAIALISIAYVGAILYSVPLLPTPVPRRRLKDLPASKDILVALAWSVALVGALTLASPAELHWKRVIGAGGIVFLLTFAKTVMLDLRDIEGDHLIGIETLPILIGRRRTILLLYAVHWSLFALVLYLGIAELAGCFPLLFSLVPFYGGTAVYLLARSRFRGEVHCQLVIDGQLLFAGVLSLAYGALA